MLKWLASILKVPKPSGPPQTMRVFRTTDPTIAQTNIEADQDAWLIDAKEPQTFRLFEINNPEAEQCLLTYRAKIKSEELKGRAFLEMWCRFPGQGEYFSKGLDQTVSGTNDWGSHETNFSLKKGQQPDLIKLNVTVEGTGRIWLKDIELLRTPLG
jgi:hypothetical protein